MRRRQATQAAWRDRNPEYFLECRLSERAALACEAAEAMSKPEAGKFGEPPRRPAPLRMGGVLASLPWDFAQDEIGVQVTDFIGVVAKVLVSAQQDQRAG